MHTLLNIVMDGSESTADRKPRKRMKNRYGSGHASGSPHRNAVSAGLQNPAAHGHVVVELSVFVHQYKVELYS